MRNIVSEYALVSLHIQVDYGIASFNLDASMANSSATVDEVWKLIKQTRIVMREFHVGMGELSVSQKEIDQLLKKTDCRFNTQWGGGLSEK